MPLIQVRDVPEHIYRRLVEQAGRERRSLAQQVVTVLARGLEVEQSPKARRKRILDEIRAQGPIGIDLPDPARLIREDRER
jgi:hypothetical protein